MEPLRIRGIFEAMRRKRDRKCYLITDQNYGAVSAICTRLYLLSNGSCIPIESEGELRRFGYLA